MHLSPSAAHLLSQLGRRAQGGRVARALRHAPKLPLVARAKNNQKNEGVYFEYEAVDPDALDEFAALADEEGEQYSWAQRSRDNKRALQQKHRSIDRKVLGNISQDAGGRKGRKGGKGRGGKGPGSDAEKRQVAAEAAAAAASDGPILAPYSPVETPAMRPRAATPDQLLSRPSPAPSSAAAAPAPASAPAAAGKQQQQQQPSAAPVQPTAPAAAGADEDGTGDDSRVTSAAGASTSGSGAPSQTPGGGNRRQRLLQRMKGSGPGAAAGDAAAPPPLPAPAPAFASSQPLPAASTPRTAPVDPAASVAAAAAAAAAAGLAPPPLDGDLQKQLAELAAALPAEEALPPEARAARSLLASILSPGGEDDRDATSGDVADMLRRDMDAAKEFQEWAARARRSGPAAGAGAGLEAELTEQEAADIAAALADLDLGDMAGLLGGGGADDDAAAEQAALEQLLGGLGGGGAADGDGDGEVTSALREVSELRSLMAALDADDADALAVNDAAGGQEELSDAQVLAALRARDPALYELLKDVPDFDALGLGDMDLDLDLDPASGNLSEAELAELEAEAAAAAAAGGGEEEELEALLRDMRGMGLMKGDGAAGDSDGAIDDADDEYEDAEDDDEDEGDTLGDLLESLGEDEGLDPRQRLQAQYALASMFNQPADELAAKGSRGLMGAGDAGDAGEEAAAGTGKRAGAPAAPGKEQPPLRGTTGMARGAVAADDEDGGAAPPPMLPRPKPRGTR
ncbi:hypothetical protein HYH02_008625 [Chlamydomonas schloesseri]|uniref:Uncharacterized protein n=1 Tax=Chlamydomonas schloesseri TaxID=2026947 RepID=A0A835WD17_9CHLO|nr:hypothetical protein HYH02_008625 [Chlamydomonas schloesseri]|eukprot:KAG2445157.1 hypothetical protein HYH02_008625 [Chlamydomonas schloesseri]